MYVYTAQASIKSDQKKTNKCKDKKKQSKPAMKSMLDKEELKISVTGPTATTTANDSIDRIKVSCFNLTSQPSVTPME